MISTYEQNYMYIIQTCYKFGEVFLAVLCNFLFKSASLKYFKNKQLLNNVVNHI